MVIRPFSTPKASSSTLTMGTKQLVVHEALDTTLWASRVEGVVVDAHHEGGVGAGGRGRDDHPGRAGLEVGGRLVAVGEEAGRLDHHVDAQVAPGQRLGVALGGDLQRACRRPRCPCRWRTTAASRRPITESYLSRWAISATEPRSLADTISMSAPESRTARKKLRPMRPKPLTPTRMVMCCCLLVTASCRTALSDHVGPGLLPVRRRRGPRSPVDVAMGDLGVVAELPKATGHLLGDGHRAVLAAGAPQGQGQVALALAHVGGQQQLEQRAAARRGTGPTRAGRARSRAPARRGRSGRAARRTQCGLGRKRQSMTRSVSRGRPCL